MTSVLPQRVMPTSVDPLIIIPRPNQIVNPTKRVRSHHNYFELSLLEMKSISKENLSRIGEVFIDDEDPNDSAMGTINSIVRHKKSRKLAFKYWDHNIHDSAPKKNSDYEHINVTYASASCKCSKPKQFTVFICATLTAEQIHRDLGPTRSRRGDRNLPSRSK